MTDFHLPPDSAEREPIRLHPANGRYFLFRGRPAVLITSAEHYGAVLNLDFNEIAYLDELQAHGLNKTRIFTGEYIERPEDIPSIGTRNTLVPASGKFLAPWARSRVPGYPRGGSKFDLDTWDEEYFHRLAGFVREAGKRDVVVEISFFCSKYKESQWEDSPMNAAGNINGAGDVPASQALTGNNGILLDYQLRLVRKFVTELKDFDNVYYEIVNEPYIDYGATHDFQERIIAAIVETEQAIGSKHMIALNVANFWAAVTGPNPNLSVFNFHYAYPPDAVAMNYALNKAIAYDETGFQGTGDAAYRKGAWEFILAGGAVFDHLDFSFAPSYENGTYPVPDQTPGGGGVAFRIQMGVLKRFIDRFDYLRMSPDTAVIAAELPEGMNVTTLAEPGEQYAIYVHGSSQAVLTLALPEGSYRAEWLDVLDGRISKMERFSHTGGNLLIESPVYVEDIALSIKRDGLPNDGRGN